MDTAAALDVHRSPETHPATARATPATVSQRDYLAHLIKGTEYATVDDLLYQASNPDPTEYDAAYLIDIMRRHWGYTR